MSKKQEIEELLVSQDEDILKLLEIHEEILTIIFEVLKAEHERVNKIFSVLRGYKKK